MWYSYLSFACHLHVMCLSLACHTYYVVIMSIMCLSLCSAKSCAGGSCVVSCLVQLMIGWISFYLLEFVHCIHVEETPRVAAGRKLSLFATKLLRAGTEQLLQIKTCVSKCNYEQEIINNTTYLGGWQESSVTHTAALKRLTRKTKKCRIADYTALHTVAFLFWEILFWCG